MTTLLINYIYYNPVGHVAEALKFSRGFHDANPGLEIHLALNKYSPTELTAACPWIAKTYPIDIYQFLQGGSGAACLDGIPRSWDYVMTETRIPHDIARAGRVGRDEEAMSNYYRVTEPLFHASRGTGTFFPRIKFPDGLKYLVDSKVELQLPQSALDFAKARAHDGPTICVLLGGSGSYRGYPAVRTWIKILHALNDKFPNLKIYLTGVRKSANGWTRTAGYTDGNIRNILNRFSNIVDCYDIGLWNQLAIVKQSGVFLSPHTGFGFLAPCVDTPWLAISGGNWGEYFFNHVPFYSVLPDNPDFPYFGNPKIWDAFKRSSKIPDMDPKNLDRKIPEIVEAAALLMDESFTFEEALKRHKRNVENANVNRANIHTGPFF